MEFFFFFQAEDGIRDVAVTGVQTCALPISGTAGSRQTTGTRGTRGSRRTSGRSARGRLGAGLVEIPPVPYRDPASAILADPQVPENRRFCASCEQPDGRGLDGRPGLSEGVC